MTDLPAGTLVAYCPKHCEEAWGRWQWREDGSVITKPANNRFRRKVAGRGDGTMTNRVIQFGLPELHHEHPDQLVNRENAGSLWTHVLRCSLDSSPGAARYRYRQEHLLDIFDGLHDQYLQPGADGELAVDLNRCLALATDADALARFRALPVQVGSGLLKL